MMNSSAENAARKNGDDAPSPTKLEEALGLLSVDEHNQDHTTPQDVSRDTNNSTQLHSIGTKNHAEADDKHEQNEFDEILFRQPESSHIMGDCPICFLPMPTSWGGKYDSFYFECCSKIICDGCCFAHLEQNPPKRGQKSQCQCPFCRSPVFDNIFDNTILGKLRVKVDDPIVMTKLGAELLNAGEDYKGAFEYFSKAASLGDIEAHAYLGLMYHTGQGVERDETKAVHYLEQASIGGHPQARYRLAYHEQRQGRMDRAFKHFIISAKLGHEDALKMVKKLYSMEFVSKEELAAAIRGHQAAIDAIKSDQREQAAKFWANGEGF